MLGKLPRAADLEFSWFVRECGAQWEAWRAYGAEWIAHHHAGLDGRLTALRALFDGYLNKLKLPSEPAWLLNRAHVVPDLYEIACPKSIDGVKYNNYVRDFLAWVLERHFSEPDDYGRPVPLPEYHNPVLHRSRAGLMRPTESVRTPLPYRFIREMREILAPGRNFRDWVWAHQACGVGEKSRGGRYGDWFEVEPAAVDHDDPDCVSRVRTVIRDNQPITITQMWSPARSVVLLVKLTLPLRTYQVRMLDSGEADTLRYTAAGWVANTGPLASGDERRPVRHGVFRCVEDRETGEIRTALYINTNKTADIGKDGNDLGYVIPWQHDGLLYWLEKLRNWQQKYNPITLATAWDELEVKHLGQTKSEVQLSRMPDACFLFRNAAARGPNRTKPISTYGFDRPWYELLAEIERRCAVLGDTLTDGRRLQFVAARDQSNDGQKTLFPLHSLRVSLLTCLALDAEVPLVVLSKLIAGHSRLFMTLYYTKVSVGRMTDVLNQASDRLDASAAEALQRFLAEASYEQLVSGAAINDEAGMRAALAARPEDRNPVGWMPRHHGICLVGGNTSPIESNSRIGGCYNGGALLKTDNRGASHTYLPVSGGAGNCVRCRWFVTEPRYLDALRAHFNNLSYHLGEQARTAQSHEQTLNALGARRIDAERMGTLFEGQAEYLRIERLWESSLAKTDQLANDVTATFRLIKRCFGLIEQARQDGAGRRQLVAVGSPQDVRVAFEDTDSELLQLAGVCLDAEIYPDEDPGKAVVRRSQLLDSALYREGVQPVFMSLTEIEQLRLGNRLMEHMANVTQPGDSALGLRKVVGLIDAGRRLAELGLADDAIELLETELRRPLARISDFTLAPPARELQNHE